MARKSPSRLEMRRQAEAAESVAKTAPKKKAATKRKKAVRKKKSAKAEVRRRLMWGVFTGSLKEESRFPYDQRDAAEERIEQLRLKNAKKLYFIQPIKEPVDGEAPVAKIPVDDTADLDEDDLPKVDDEEPDVIEDEVDEIDDTDDLEEEEEEEELDDDLD
ncbi:hypothetical protein [uncultured Gimesia sp.]|jgi:hypothetical protein|uniref:hypothetical protein n=1 Tax=uncultured Gimesia sp. TaxID=1678688 RepID=UPI00262C7DBD|nr:hypothetical protein [uncultured Gimesia sp.]